MWCVRSDFSRAEGEVLRRVGLGWQARVVSWGGGGMGWRGEGRGGGMCGVYGQIFPAQRVRYRAEWYCRPAQAITC